MMLHLHNIGFCPRGPWKSDLVRPNGFAVAKRLNSLLPLYQCSHSKLTTNEWYLAVIDLNGEVGNFEPVL
jgi:hypothetical protein